VPRAVGSLEQKGRKLPLPVQMPRLNQPPTEPVGSKAERRHLTVLFCDIVGSTALSTELDPEDLRQVLLTYRDHCSDAIRRYDGHVARFMGDGVLAYFGFPTAHEDDAERAVHAALQIERISTIPVPRAPPLRVRIGIATGLVVVGDLIGDGPSREFALVGEAPNLAAWLQSNARPNQILVSPNTQRLLGRLFEFEDLGERPLKGTDELVRMWSVVRPTALPTRFEAYRSQHLTTFVGRDLELAMLKSRFEKAKRGEGQVVTISGEPGIGKSRLIIAFRQLIAGEPGRTLMFQCSSYHQSSPWYPIIRHFEDTLEINQGDSPELKLQKLEALVRDRLGDQRPEVVPLLAALLAIPTGDRYPPLELTPQQQKKRTFAAMLELVRTQSLIMPLILIGEDIHWMDPTTAELLELFRQHAKDWRVLIVLSFRPEHRLPEREATAAINLRRLEPTDAAAMIDAIATDRTLPREVTAQIIAKTDGVPLFVEEVTKAVLDNRAVKQKDIGSEAFRPTVVPDSLHDSLMARLDQLAPIKTVAQIASAIGREFAFGVLEAVAPFSRDQLRDAIDQLQTAGLLFRREAGIVETYSFKHALVQDAAYASMLRAERRKLHLRIAETLSTEFLDTSEGAPELIAYHYTEAGQTNPAVQNWFKAGKQALRRTAVVETINHFQSALRLIPDLPDNAERDQLELELLQALAAASIVARGFGAAETVSTLERALKLCGKLGSAPQSFAVLNGLIGVHLMRGEFEQARRLAGDLLERAQQAGDATALIMGHRVLGMSLFVLGELDDAQRELRQAMDLYDPVRHAPLAVIFSQDFKASAQAYFALTIALLGDVEEGLLHSREALAYAEQLRHPHSICYVLPFLAGAYLIADMPQAALPVTERTITLSAEYGFPQWIAGALMLRAWARVELGDAEAGLADSRRAIEALKATGTRIWMQFTQFILARALAATGQVTTALEMIEQIQSDIGASSGRWYEAEVHRVKGNLLRQEGKPGAAACYQAAIAVADRQGARLLRRRAADALAALHEPAPHAAPGPAS